MNERLFGALFDADIPSSPRITVGRTPHDEAPSTTPGHPWLAPVRQLLLERAIDITTENRNVAYGKPSRNFDRIAALWNVYLDMREHPDDPLSGADTAAMMILLKVARIMHDPDTVDNWTDIAGYAATGWESFVDTYHND